MESIDIAKILSEEYKENKYIVEPTKPVVLYGAGTYGFIALNILKENNITPIAVCDSDDKKIGTDFFGFNVISFDQALKQNSNFQVLIASWKYYDEIKNNILEYVQEYRILSREFLNYRSATDFKDILIGNQAKFVEVYNKLADDESKYVMEKLIRGRLSNSEKHFTDIYTDEQYFDKVNCLSDDEVFIDGGAFTGDTLEKFVKLTNSNFMKVHCFEPSMRIFNQLEKTKREVCGNDKRILLHNKGLYNCQKTISFNNNIGAGGDRIIEELDSDNKIEVVAIDEFINDPVSFIKMDIEGSELKALEGAKNTILKNKPKLAICVYHNLEDLITIPEFIMNLGLDYKYYLRHHGDAPYIIYETVFYAI